VSNDCQNTRTAVWRTPKYLNISVNGETLCSLKVKSLRVIYLIVHFDDDIVTGTLTLLLGRKNVDPESFFYSL
jgi:hypothetical protein